MKNACIAMVCTLAVAACGGEERRPAQEPVVTTTSVTETTTTRQAPSAAKSTPSDTSRANADSQMPHARVEALPETSPNAGSTGNTAPTGLPSPTPDLGAAAPATPSPGSPAANADNTKVNERDRKGSTLTPMDQGGGGDRDITAAVRRAVVGDKALSFTAKNVKIITVGGKVTLRGPVKSEDEKSAIEAKAKATPGVASVDNQLEVKK